MISKAKHNESKYRSGWHSKQMAKLHNVVEMFSNSWVVMKRCCWLGSLSTALIILMCALTMIHPF